MLAGDNNGNCSKTSKNHTVGDEYEVDTNMNAEIFFPMMVLKVSAKRLRGRLPLSLSDSTMLLVMWVKGCSVN